MSYRVGERGKVLRVAAMMTLLPATEIELELRKPNGVRVVRRRSQQELTLGSVRLWEAVLGLYLEAYQYVECPMEPDLFNRAGTWTARLKSIEPTRTLRGDAAPFVVEG